MNVPSPAATPARASRGRIGYLVAAVAPLALVVILAFSFGVVRAPSLDRLTDTQKADLPGIVWTQYNEREGCTDLIVLRAEGDANAIACDESLDRIVGWTEDGVFVVTGWGSGLEVRNPVTGEVLSQPSADSVSWDPEQRPESPIATRRIEGSFIVSLASGVTLWEVPADSRYDIGASTVSPDRRWVAMADSAERLLVVRADGSEPPAVWTTGFPEWSWALLVWEGTEPPADLPF